MLSTTKESSKNMYVEKLLFNIQQTDKIIKLSNGWMVGVIFFII